MFAYLAPRWWNYLERTRRCGLEGDVSLEVGFDILKDSLSVSSLWFKN